MRNPILIAMIIGVMSAGNYLYAAEKTFSMPSQLLLEVDTNFANNDPQVPKTFSLSHGWNLGWGTIPSVVATFHEYRIDFGDGSTPVDIVAIDPEEMRTLNHTYNQAGIYTITATVTESSTTFKPSRSVTVLVGSLDGLGYQPTIISTQSLDHLTGNGSTQNGRLVADDTRIYYIHQDFTGSQIHIADVDSSGSTPIIDNPRELDADWNTRLGSGIISHFEIFPDESRMYLCVDFPGRDRADVYRIEAVENKDGDVEWGAPVHVTFQSPSFTNRHLRIDPEGDLRGVTSSYITFPFLPVGSSGRLYEMGASGTGLMHDQIPGLMSTDGAIRVWDTGWGAIFFSADGPQPAASLFDYYNNQEINTRYQVMDGPLRSGFTAETLSRDGSLLVATHRSSDYSGHSVMYLVHLGVPSVEARAITKENVIAPTLLGSEPHRSSPHRSDINRDGKSDAADLVH